MAIIQISKIQQRSGNLVDLPQLDEAEFGWASDAKRLFIGKTTPNENIEVLTSYSTIDFSQLNGSIGNLNINPVTIAAGEVLTYDGTNWVNRGGNAGGLITLGSVANVKITGGAIGYVLETDGTGNLSWTPKATVTAYVQNVTKASPAVITTTQNNFFTNGALVTITNVPGMTQLNGNSYYAKIVTSNTFSLYTDSAFTTPVNSTAYGTFPYATVSATDTVTDYITVSDATPFTVNDPVVFGNIDSANTAIVEGQTYYVKAKDTVAPNTWIQISETVGGTTFSPSTKTGLTGFVYTTGGRVISAVGGSGTANAGGSSTSVQYNNGSLLDGDSNFTWDFTNQILSVNGNANVGNLNANGVVTSTRFISNVATGTAPLTVTSTTRVSNLSVSYANVSDFGVVTTQTTGTFYPTFVSSSATGNRALGANANLSFNAATGALAATLLTGTLTSTSQPNITTVGTLGSLAVTGNVTAGNFVGTFANGTSSIAIPTASGNINLSAGGGSTEIVITATGINIAGTLNATGNANVGNLGTAGLITATGNVTGGNLTTGGVVSATGNVSGGNLTTGGVVAATGNVTGANLTTAGVVDATGNVSGGNLTTAGVVAATGNVTGGNLTTGGVVSATGNVSGGNLTTTGVLSVTGNANVGNIGAATAIFTTGNITTINSGLMQNGTSNITITSGANVTIGVASTARLTATTTGANVTGTLGVTGNANVGNIGATNGVFTNVSGNGSALTSINGTNVTGAVAFATTANAVAGANVSGQVSFAATANSVAGANVSGTVASATTAGTVTASNQPNITSVSTSFTNLTFANAQSITGNNMTLTTGANTNLGTITGNWSLSAGSRLQATYADLAEYYEADDIYGPGTVLMFGGDKEVTIAEDGTNRVAGVVSTNPAYVMNSTCPGLLTAIALQGRVPCKVRGNIKKGDMLISGGDGYARPNQFPTIGTVIGKALEDFEGIEGVIEVAVGRL